MSVLSGAGLSMPDRPDVKRRKKRDDASVKVDRTVVEKAKTVANRRGVTLAEYFTGLVKDTVERDFAKAVKELGAKSPK